LFAVFTALSLLGCASDLDPRLVAHMKKETRQSREFRNNALILIGGALGLGFVAYMLLSPSSPVYRKADRQSKDLRRRLAASDEELAKDHELDRLERLVEIQEKAREAGINESLITGHFGGAFVESAHQRRKEKK
jgi:hypothetical protein